MQNVVNLVNQNEGLRKQNLSLQQENAQLRRVIKILCRHEKVELVIYPEENTNELFQELQNVREIIKQVLDEEVCK